MTTVLAGVMRGTAAVAALAFSAGLAVAAAAAVGIAQPPAAAASPAPAADDDAKTVQAIQDNCTRCHDVSMITAARHTPAEWAATVQLMRQRGSTLPDEDVAAVVAYLSRTFPK